MLKTLLSVIVIAIAVACLVATESRAAEPPDAADASKAARDVSTLLIDHCVSCHGPAQQKGGLDLSRRATALKGGKSGPAIVAGSADESVLIEKLAEGTMPPKGPLAPTQVAAVRAWVDAGAHYVGEPLQPRRAGLDWWSLRPIRAVAVPDWHAQHAAAHSIHGTGIAALGHSSRHEASAATEAASWIKTPIDAFIHARHVASGLSAAPEADPVALIRRVTFDLTGLPPRAEAVEAFVAASGSDPMAYEALVDRLLASPQYGERWGRHWLDVVRFGESQGYETNLPRPGAWPYRDYVIRALNRDAPFPSFVFDQLAGDLSRGDWLTQAATGFLVGGTHDIVGNQTLDGMLQQRADDLDDMITATGTTFLGLTIQCARCHDHKFDPIAQKDYYSLQAIFAGVNHAERELSVPESEDRLREVAMIASELAGIERQFDAGEPLAQPGSDVAARPAVNPRRNVERFMPVRARMVRFTILATSDRIEPCLDEIEVYSIAQPGEPTPRNVALASAGGVASASSEYPDSALHEIAHLNDGRVGNGRSWISRTAGKGSVTIRWPDAATIDRIVWGRDREQVYRDRLATEYYVEVALEPGQWQVVASSLDRLHYDPNAVATGGPSAASAGPGPAVSSERAELAARQTRLRQRLTQLSATRKVYAGTFNQPGPTFLLVRGDPTRKGPAVPPSTLTALTPRLTLDSSSPEPERRAALARWLADPSNPLPARVMVNRVWHYHFGRGIVATPSDFGFNGAPPSHPELLDWLAATYIASGWRLKPLHRLIVTSAVYRQSSRLDPKAQSVDRDNRLLWRMTPRRLEAESLRDAILATSGQLDTRMGGPGYNIWEPNTNYVAVYKPRAELGPDTFRRMVYQFKPRSQPDPTFSAFDCPDAALVAPRRNVSTTALQALNLLNSRFVIQQAGSFAQRLEAACGTDVVRQAEHGFRLAFGRAPTDAERKAAASLIQSHGCAAFCRALYNANEFVYVP